MRAAGCRRLDRSPRRYRAGERHQLGPRRCRRPRSAASWLRCRCWNTPAGRPGRVEGLLKALRAQGRLGGMLEQHRIAGRQSRDDAVHRGEVGIVPGRDDEHQSQRFVADEPREARLRLAHAVGQRPWRHLQHVAGALLQAPDLAGALRDRPAHLPGDLGRQLVALRHQQARPPGPAPRSAARPGLPASAADACPGALQRRCHLGPGGKRTLDQDTAVDRRDGSLGLHCRFRVTPGKALRVRRTGSMVNGRHCGNSHSNRRCRASRWRGMRNRRRLRALVTLASVRGANGANGDVTMSGATRRCVLQHVGGAAIAGVGCLAGTHRATAQTAPSPRLRSEASTAAGAANLVIYRAAVRYMRSLPSTDRRSWAYQVSIHNNWCPHRNWYLLPWHREYLLALERHHPQSAHG